MGIQFCHIDSKNTFEYNLNGDTSVSLSYKGLINVNISIRKDSNWVDEFTDTIEGKVFGGLFLEKYPAKDYSYLISDGRYHKIGMSNDPNKRIKNLKTANPSCVLLITSNLLSERLLHDIFFHKKYDREWFDLSDSDVSIIKDLMSKTTTNSLYPILRLLYKRVDKNTKTKHTEKRVSSLRMPFGKHKGKLLDDMKSNEEIGYLFWLEKNLRDKNEINSALYKRILNIVKFNR